MENKNGAAYASEMEKYGMYFALERKNRKLNREIDNFLNSAILFLAITITLCIADIIYKFLIIPQLF